MRAHDFEQALIFVDLDNTLIRSDLTLEPLLRLLKQNPVMIFLLPLWLLRGKQYFKQKLVQQVTVEAEHLPYDLEVVDRLKTAKSQGSTVVLATASHRAFAEPVAEYLGMFDQVIASDNTANTKGREKLKAMQVYAGDRAFAYWGDSHADIAIWQASEQACLVRPAPGVKNKLDKLGIAYEQIGDPIEYRKCLRAIRPWQWLKNVLVFVPLLLAKAVGDFDSSMATLSTFVAFSFCASAGYILNDLLDIEADRQHPRKQHRPFVSGAIPLWYGVCLSAIFFCLSMLLSLSVSLELMLSLLIYFLFVTAYSLEWKEHAILDVLLLAGFYAARLISGAVAAEVALSFWLMAFAIFLFLSLAAVKRCTELRSVQKEDHQLVPGRGYTKEDEPLLFTMGIASGYVSVVVIALYINSDEVKSLYSSPQVLWLVCPLVLYWLSRVWLKTSRQEMHDDPIIFAMRDKVSLVCACLLALLLLLASAY